MGTLNQLLSEVEGLVASLLLTTTLYAFIGGMIGLVASLFFIRIGRKRNWFKRSNQFWSFLVKLNYIFFPIVVTIIGITQGAVWGAHTTSEKWIDEATKPIIDYLETYIPEMQLFCNTYIVKSSTKTANITVSDLVYMQEEKAGINHGFFAREVKKIALTSVLSLTESMGDLVEPVDALLRIDLYHLDRSVFDVLPISLKSANSLYFAYFYWILFSPFLIYFLVVISEFILAKILGKTSKKSHDVYTGGSQIEYV